MFFVLVTRDQPGGVEELEFIRNPITRPWSLAVSTSFQRSQASETNDSTRVELPMITRFMLPDSKRGQDEPRHFVGHVAHDDDGRGGD